MLLGWGRRGAGHIQQTDWGAPLYKNNNSYNKQASSSFLNVTKALQLPKTNPFISISLKSTTAFVASSISAAISSFYKTPGLLTRRSFSSSRSVMVSSLYFSFISSFPTMRVEDLHKLQSRHWFEQLFPLSIDCTLFTKSLSWLQDIKSVLSVFKNCFSRLDVDLFDIQMWCMFEIREYQTFQLYAMN